MYRATPYRRPFASSREPLESFNPSPLSISPGYCIPSYGNTDGPIVSDDPDSLESRTLFFGRLPAKVTSDDMRDLCEKFGEIKRAVVYDDKHIGFVDFYDLRHAKLAHDELKGTEIRGKLIEVQFSAPKKLAKDVNTGTLFCRPRGGGRNFVDPNSVADYKELFGKQGCVKKVSVNRKRESEKFIEFYDYRDATKAQEVLDGYNFNGVVLEIQFAQNPSRTINKSHSHKGIKESFGSYRGPEAWGPISPHPLDYYGYYYGYGGFPPGYGYFGSMPSNYYESPPHSIRPYSKPRRYR